MQQYLFKTILVCGGRDYNDFRTLSKVLHALSPKKIIQGGAKGADYHALQFAIENNIPYETFMADWDKYKKGAGPIRNKQMLIEGCPDFTVAFPGGNGTLDMIAQSIKNGKPVLKVNELGKIKIL